MTPLQISLMRLDAVSAEIDRLRESEFPYPHSQHALDALSALFKSRADMLRSFDSISDPDIVQMECERTLENLFEYTEILGIVLRSTNVRNAFEVYGPLLRMCRALLEPNVKDEARSTRLILSSEWNYSPFLRTDTSNLKGFVFIGLPAHESSNPFLLPLAGHEIGHSVWNNERVFAQIKPALIDVVLKTIKARWDEFQNAFPNYKITPAELANDLFAANAWGTSAEWALSQAEESFCDILGVKIFGAAYMHSFAYLLAPNLAGPRSETYPKIQQRVADMMKAARKYGYTVPDDFSSMFSDDKEPKLSEAEKYLLSVADAAQATVVNKLIDRAGTIVDRSGVGSPTTAETSRILKRLKFVVPAEHISTVADIINAGWDALHDDNFWINLEHINEHKLPILKELLLKNIEVFEIEQILQA